jgi:uncharacterized protein YggT (Ycf19 family)
MRWIDLILNLVGIAFWLSWRSSMRPVKTLGAGTLVSNLKPVELPATARWLNPVGLAVLLIGRPFLYVELARMTESTAAWSPGPVTVAFRDDVAGRLSFFSVLSFLWALLVWQAALTLFSRMARLGDRTAGLRWFQELGALPGRWPAWLALLVPTLLGTLMWAVVATPFASRGLIPAIHSATALAFQSTFVGVSVWMPSRWMIVGLLIVRFVHDYVYLGDHALWSWVRLATTPLIRPLQWLPVRLGRIDGTPLIVAALVLGLAYGLDLGIRRAFLLTGW